jgi:two-component system sensor histidine kinase TctE
MLPMPSAPASPGRGFSLRNKLLTPLLWLWIVSALAAALAAFWLTGLLAESAFDRSLRDDAVALGSQIRWDGDGPRFSADARTASSLVYDSFAPSHFTVRTDGGRLLVGNAELLPPRSAQEEPANAATFYEEDTPWGQLRLVAMRMERPLQAEAVWVIVGESLAQRRQVTRELAKAIFLPAAALGFIIVPLILLGVRAGLAPAMAVSAAIERRGIDDLSPLPLADVPEELLGMVQHTNDLLARLETAVAHERRFISDAAHQLRTPVAGIKLLVEDMHRGFQKNPQQPPDGEVLDTLFATCNHATRLVRQLLALARSSAADQVATELVDLRSLVSHALDKMAPAAALAGKRLQRGPGLAAPHLVTCRAAPLMLEEALINLIDNALRYGGDCIEVDLARSALGTDRWDIVVFDNGPSLDEETRRRMLSPFWRGADVAPDGTGLGLPIAEKAMKQMGGAMPVPEAPAGGGTRFRLQLPPLRS